MGGQDNLFAFIRGAEVLNGLMWELALQGLLFSDGDMIRFTMDCDAATLSVQVNGCTPRKAFSGVRPFSGFELRPMVMLWKDASSQSGVCRHLNFKRVRKAA